LTKKETLSNSYSTGSVTGSSIVGGLVGDFNVTGTISNCGWWSGAGPAKAIASPAGDVTYSEANNNVFFNKTHNVYDSVTPYWDFVSIWRENVGTYPTLK